LQNKDPLRSVKIREVSVNRSVDISLTYRKQDLWPEK